MCRFRSLTALLLLALWLPVTLHCGLEAAGLMGSEGFACCSQEQSCANDGCTEIESGHFRPANDVAKVPAPELRLDLLASVDLFSPLTSLSVLRGSESVAPRSASFERPLDWVTDWRFVRRQALPARAPDSPLA